MRAVYLDHAATSPVDRRVADAMAACLADPGLQGNPASLHAAGRAAAERLTAARAQVASIVNVSPDAIAFTSGATESVNLAILNALPLPMLDGGRMAFVIVEILRRGRRIAPAKEALIHLVGFAAMLILVVVLSYFDIARIVRGDSLFR